MITHISLCFLLLVTSISSFAADARTSSPATSPDAVAFARLKSLAGEWEADSTMGKIHARYEVASGGNVLLEHMSVAGKHDDMITVYYLEDGKLVLTHYCEMGNEPHMAAQRIDPATGEIQFDFAGAANLASPDAPHMHAAVIRVVDADHFLSKWTLFEKSQPKLAVSAQYVRVK